MTNVVTPAQVENKLIQLSKEIDEAHNDLVLAEDAYSNARATWEINSARARLGIAARALESGRKITVQEKEDEALVRCADELRTCYATEALVRAARANGNRLRTQVDITRSVGTTVRAAIDMS